MRPLSVAALLVNGDLRIGRNFIPVNLMKPVAEIGPVALLSWRLLMAVFVRHRAKQVIK